MELVKLILSQKEKAPSTKSRADTRMLIGRTFSQGEPSAADFNSFIHSHPFLRLSYGVKLTTQCRSTLPSASRPVRFQFLSLTMIG